MPRYLVLSDINCGQFKPGDVAEFSEDEAQKMPHALRLVAEEVTLPEASSVASSEPSKKKRGKK